jgi:two-component system sensor histidine kinase AgrC
MAYVFLAISLLLSVVILILWAKTLFNVSISKKNTAIFVLPITALAYLSFLFFYDSAFRLLIVYVLVLFYHFCMLKCSFKRKLIIFASFGIFNAVSDLFYMFVPIFDLTRMAEFSYRTHVAVIAAIVQVVIIVIIFVIKRYAIRHIISVVEKHYQILYFLVISLFLTTTAASMAAYVLFNDKKVIGSIFIPIVMMVLIIIILYFINIQKVSIEKKHYEQLKQYQKTIEELYQNTRAFRHNQKNMLIAIDGYLKSGDSGGLHITWKKYRRSIKMEKKPLQLTVFLIFVTKD